MTELDTTQERTPGAPPAWEYADAPESKDIVTLQDRYGLFIGGEFVEPKSGRYMATIDPSTEEVLAEVPEAGAEDVDLAVTAARDAFDSRWRDLPGRERAKYLYRIARALQERAREFAVLESMNGGKPIKESRDIDLPLAAAHFFYYAGWADKLDYAFPGKDREADRRGRPGDPLELPDADGRMEARAGAGHREHHRAQARRDDAAHRAVAGRGDPGGGAPARSRERDHGSGGDRCRARRRRRGQGRVHRIHGGRQGDPPHRGGDEQAAHPRAGRARPPTSCSRTRRWTRPSRAS